LAFKLIKNGQHAVMETHTVTDSEAITKGEALIMASGKLTKAAAGGPVGYIALQDVAAGTSKTCRVLMVEPGQVFECAYTGTPAGGFVLGVAAADIDSTGLLVNAADVTGGPCTVHYIDTTNTKCHVVFNNTYTTVA
jgi:hypothetical protein